MVKKHRGLAQIIIGRAFILFVLLLMYAPIIVLMIFSFTESTNVGTWEGFSLQLYVDLFKNKEIMQALFNTLMVALTSGVVATILGTLGAIGTFYMSRNGKKIMEGMTQIPIINAEVVIAISLAVLIVAVGAKFNFLTLLLGHVVLTVAFVYLSVKPKLMQMDPSIYEAALDLGATPSHAMRRVIFPEILPGIISGFMLSVTLSLDDYIITAFLRDNSFETISTYVQGVIAKSSIPPALRALTTVIFLIALLVLFVNNWKQKQEEKMKVFHTKGKVTNQ